jgi:copper chaperone CopZ
VLRQEEKQLIAEYMRYKKWGSSRSPFYYKSKQETKEMKSITSKLQLILLLALFAFAATAFAQEESKTEATVVKFETSAYSFMCKNRIEGEVSKIDGVKECFLDMDTKVLEVKYDKEKTDEEAIKKTVVDLGYECKKKCDKEKS